MTDAEIARIIDTKKAANLDTDSADRRKDIGARYAGDLYGDERRGQSQVVTRQVLEVIEWTLPSLLRVFMSSDKVAEFIPIGEEDEDSARQETFFVNKAFLSDNNGFAILYTWLKDTLMSPNAYLKVYWDTKDEVTTESYEGLTGQDVALILEDPTVEPAEQKSSTISVLTPQGPIDVEVYDVTFRRTQTRGRLEIVPVPPEEMTVSRGLTEVSLDGADFVCHSPLGITRSDLIQMGFDRKIIDSLTTYDEEDEADDRREELARDEATDKSMEVVEFDEAYLWFDDNNDGIAEFRKISKSGDVILENVEVEYLPFVGSCSVPLPHAHVGMSWAELVADLQKIYTVLTRQLLNNLYRTNNPRTIIGKGVNLSDVINDLPNSPIRADDINAIRIEPTAPIIQSVIPAFGVLDQIKESRVGASRITMGLDADTLAQSTKGAFMGALEQSNQRIELLARIFAEMSLKPLFLKIHHLLLTNQTEALTAKANGKWVKVNPAEWKKREDMQITVGLGAGNKQEQLMAIKEVMAVQAQLMASGGMGIVKPENIFNSASKLVESAGLYSAYKYFTNPGEAGQQPAQPKPEDGLAAAQMELAKVEREKYQAKSQDDMRALQFKIQEATAKHEREIDKMHGELMAKGEELELKRRDLERREMELLVNSDIALAKTYPQEIAPANQMQATAQETFNR